MDTVVRHDCVGNRATLKRIWEPNVSLCAGQSQCVWDSCGRGFPFIPELMKGLGTWMGGEGRGGGEAGRRRQRGRRHEMWKDEEGENGMRWRGTVGGDGKGQRDAVM